VVGADERDEHAARTRRRRTDYHGDVARSVLEERDDRRLGQHVRRAVDEHEIDVLLDGEPNDVVCRCARDERRGSCSDTRSDQSGTVYVEGGSRRPEIFRSVDEPGQDQLLRWSSGKRLGEREERVELVPLRGTNRIERSSCVKSSSASCRKIAR
jgi:hypothetical protein